MIVVVGLIIAFILLLVFSNRKTRRCRWRQDRTQDVDGARYYHCTACGAEAFSKDGAPPKECLKRFAKT